MSLAEYGTRWQKVAGYGRHLRSTVTPAEATERTELATHAQTAQMIYPDGMDHLEVLREKIGRLRAEIAQIQESNQQYRRQGRNETDAQIAHGQRHERLQAIQQELAQLADLGRKVRSVEEMKEKHRSRLHLIKKVS